MHAETKTLRNREITLNAFKNHATHPFTMSVAVRMAAILFLATWRSGYGCDDMAVYKVTVRFLWSEEKFPKDYPLYRPKAQWSPVFGQSHNSSYTLYRLGEVAKPSVRDFAQFGKLSDIVKEGEGESCVYDQFSADAVDGVGETGNIVFVDEEHTMVSVISRMIPSPDWFVGVDSLNLCVDSKWLDQITLDLEPLDAGAASGLTFTAPRWATTPPASVSRHGPRTPDHPAAGFYYPELRELPTIAKIEFAKVKEYTTQELNNLRRKELIESMMKKKRKDVPHRRVNRVDVEVTTKSDIEKLMDLEEDPVGTPKPNVPENNVVVVTKAPVFTTPILEFGDLRNMDDVILAVARGRQLGQSHLPRHFRSRLHHAVNTVQPTDCLVSDWSPWTPCSTTCGFGDKFRTRTVVRPKTGQGWDCPPLKERQHCGNINSCAQIDYFEW